MRIFEIVTVFFIGMAVGSVHAQPADPKFFFDSDGGKCSYEQGTVYAEFGVEGMAYIEGGNKYTGSGGFILDHKILKNGLVQYHIGPMEEGIPDYYITLDPKGGMISAKVKDRDVIYEEGVMNTLRFKPCEH